MSAAREFAAVYGRELDRLAAEVAAYPDDETLWSVAGAQKNSPGTLAVHTVGGLLHFIGAALGDTGYVRDRDFEFAERGLSRDEVAARVRECRALIVPILEGLDEDVLAREHPGPVPPPLRGATTRAFLMHLLWHLGWHTGHIYYHRLALDGSRPHASS